MSTVDEFTAAAGFEGELVKADGFDEACIGIIETFEPRESGEAVHSNRLVYDVERMVDTLVERDGMTRDEAYEYIEFNMFGAYVSDNQPAYLVIRSPYYKPCRCGD